ncbi:tRNA (34-2'-O)-methyltransferase regulator WDR6 [Epinephelus lanceolatus]|uniref:WD repeat-containing protein 6 n=1 Tax=Epinephelus lanceolatus TaxID=310571 RepID=UPI0014482111|nr:WD repeat-containing protein 6 [Epinephelus lanceolatus]
METAALVAPVTAVEFLQDAFLLTGEGPVLTVYSLHPRPKACASLSVLQHYRIHGIRPRSLTAVPAQSSPAGTHGNKNDEPSSNSSSTFYDLAVFGGKAVRLMRLHVDLQDDEHLCLETLGPLMELQDWALDVRWLSGDKHPLLCVAVAHNSALVLDVTTGKALVQCSCLEGCLLYSALLLVHESWADTILVGGTVFNQLVLWKPGGGDNSNESEHKAPVEKRLLGHSGVIFSICYLQEKGWLASASDDRSIRVWGVGTLGGPGGKCGDLNPACLRVLYGHQARVFSVYVSSGNVFSAGEDGACLVWDWAGGGKVVRTLKGHRAGGVRALAVSEGTGDEGRWVATGGADGGVRLWRVEGSEEREERTEEAVTEKLTDLKFPGQGLPKAVCIAGDKNASWSQTKFVVCTDQGTVYQYSDGQWELVWQGTPEFQSYCVMELTIVNIKDSAAKVSLCAVGNLSGSIQVFPISHPQCGILLPGGSGKIHSLIWQEAKEGLYLLASGAEGLVCRWCVEAELDENSSLALSVNPLSPFLLPPCAKRWLTAAVRLHSTSQGLLWVCGDRRGSLLLFQEEAKLEQKMGDEKRVDEGSLTGRKQTDDEWTEENGSGGNRKGEMMEERGGLKLYPLSCLFGVHGKQGVTSVYEYQGLLYSTGRDGCVRVFRVNLTTPGNLTEKSNGASVENKGGLQLEVLRVQRACKGMEWLERVLILEPDIPVEEEEEEEEPGEECEKLNLTEKLEVIEERKEEGSFRGEKTENKEREAKFAIVGFHAVHFVVWDPVRQERLLAVPCGGGHRSWCLWPSHKGVWPGYGALVFIKQGAVLASQPPGEALSSAGKAGRTAGWSLREGVHGRGIGCICRLGMIRETGNEIQTNSSGDLTETEGRDGLEDEAKDREEGHWEIVVTGGEDTSLTVLAVHPNSGSIRVLSVITDHISSVRTVTAVTRSEGGSENQTQSLSALLVSAGGRAQMQCYRLLIGWDRQRLVPSCQVIQVASNRLDEQWERRRNRHKTVKVDPETRYMSVAVVDEKTDCALLALACSDGALRLFSVSEVKHQIDLLWETFYHQRCVLSVSACSLEDGKGNRYKLLFSAATDGRIAVWDMTDASSLSTTTSSSAPTPPIPCLDIHAHQSGVNSLAVWAEKLGQQEGGCLVTVASGGDDGQLTVSTIRVQYPEDGETGGSRGISQISEQVISQQTQFQIPNQLHLHLHSQSHIPLAHAAPLTALKLLSPGLVVSTSSDQRVCLWRVNTTSISHAGALCSHVADAAGLAVWEGQMIEEEEGNEKRETRFEPEQEIVIWRGKRNQTGLKTLCKTAAQFNTDKQTLGEAEDGGPVEAMSETGDPVCQTSDEKGGETAGECRNQTETDSVGETESEVNTEMGFKASCESKKTKMGWVLVCGQGFQLLRVQNTEMDAEVWAAGGEKEKVDHRVKVTLPVKST